MDTSDKFVVYVKGRGFGWVRGTQTHYTMKLWCLDNIGKIGWDYVSTTDAFVFFDDEDAVAFRLKFGL